MKWTLLIFGCASLVRAGVPSNSITISNHTGQAVNQPYIISRFFAAGEIQHFPQPVVVRARGGDRPIDQWQSNIKTRWPDGSVQHALVSFWKSTDNDTSDVIRFTDTENACHLGDQATCEAAGLDGPGMAGFNGGTWGATIYASQNSTMYTTDARDLIQAGFVKYWVRGPIATVAIVEDRSPARTKDFGWTCGDTYRITADASTDTFTTFDNATGTTAMPHGFVNGETVNLGTTALPGPQPVFTATSKLSTHHFIVNATANTFQIANTAGGAPIDLTTAGAGPTYVSACGSNDYSPVQHWQEDRTYRSLHPQFILTFFPGWNGVYLEYVMQNGWTTAIQDQRYQLTLTKDSAKTPIVPSATITHYARTEWVYRAWSGTPTTLEFPSSGQIYNSRISPPNFSIDLNKQYIIYSKMVPQHDPRLPVDPGFAYRTDVTSYQTAMTGSEPFYCQKSANGQCGNFLMAMASTGGRGDIGLNPRWYVRYLYTFDPKLFWSTLGNADLSGTLPYHLWEGATGKWYDSGHTADAFGLPLSVNARPTVNEYFVGYALGSTATSVADRFTFVDPFPASVGSGYSLSFGFNWDLEYAQSDPQHNPAFHYIPYLTTGDYFYLEDGLSYVSQYLARTAFQWRHSDWGVAYSGTTRGYAWTMRGLFQMAVMAPDGTPEKAYYADKINVNLAQFEALYGVTDGNFTRSCDPDTFNANTETNVYCWSLYGRIGAATGFNRWSIPLIRNSVVSGTNGTVTSGAEGLFQGGFQNIVMGWAAELGFKSDKLAQQIGRLWTQLVLVGNPRDVEQYIVPVSLIQPTGTLAANVNSTTLTIPLTAAPTWNGAVPFPVRLDGEWIYICSVSGTTLTACQHGRGSLRANSQTGSGAVAHNAGATLAMYNFSPYISSLAEWTSGMLPQFQNMSPPFRTFDDTEHGYATISLAALSFADSAMYEGLSRLDAFARLRGMRDASGFKYTNSYNPKFMMIPRRDPIRNASAVAAKTEATITYDAPVARTSDAACTVDGVDDGQRDKRHRTFVKTGLQPGREYTSVIHCVADYYDSGDGTGNVRVRYNTAAEKGTVEPFSITSRLFQARSQRHLE